MTAAPVQTATSWVRCLQFSASPSFALWQRVGLGFRFSTQEAIAAHWPPPDAHPSSPDFSRPSRPTGAVPYQGTTLPSLSLRCWPHHLLLSVLSCESTLATSARPSQSAHLPFHSPWVLCKQSALLGNGMLGLAQRRPDLELLQRPGLAPDSPTGQTLSPPSFLWLPTVSAAPGS